MFIIPYQADVPMYRVPYANWVIIGLILLASVNMFSLMFTGKVSKMEKWIFNPDFQVIETQFGSYAHKSKGKEDISEEAEEAAVKNHAKTREFYGGHRSDINREVKQMRAEYKLKRMVRDNPKLTRDQINYSPEAEEIAAMNAWGMNDFEKAVMEKETRENYAAKRKLVEENNGVLPRLEKAEKPASTADAEDDEFDVWDSDDFRVTDWYAEIKGELPNYLQELKVEDSATSKTFAKYFSLIGHMFVHSGIFEAIINLIFLFAFGNSVCAKIGNKLFPVLFVGFGILGAIICYLATPSKALVGSSAAIYGVFGMYLMFFPSNEVTCLAGFGTRVSAFTVRGFWIIGLWVFLGMAAYVMGLDHIATESNAANVTTFLAGLIIATIMLANGWTTVEPGERTLVGVLNKENEKKWFAKSIVEYERPKATSRGDIRTIQEEEKEDTAEKLDVIPVESPRKKAGQKKVVKAEIAADSAADLIQVPPIPPILSAEPTAPEPVRLGKDELLQLHGNNKVKTANSHTMVSVDSLESEEKMTNSESDKQVPPAPESEDTTFESVPDFEPVKVSHEEIMKLRNQNGSLITDDNSSSTDDNPTLLSVDDLDTPDAKAVTPEVTKPQSDLLQVAPTPQSTLVPALSSVSVPPPPPVKEPEQHTPVLLLDDDDDDDSVTTSEGKAVKMSAADLVALRRKVERHVSEQFIGHEEEDDDNSEINSIAEKIASKSARLSARTETSLESSESPEKTANTEDKLVSNPVIEQDAIPVAELIRFNCGFCGTEITAPVRNAGRPGRCPQCHEAVRVPKRSKG